MTVTAAYGWEMNFAAGILKGDPTPSGTASISSAHARTGTYSARSNPASGAQGFWSLASCTTYFHFGIYVATLPSVDRIIAGATGVGTINVRLTSAGALAVYLDIVLIGTSSSTAFATAGWHWVGLRLVTGTSVVLLQIDGANAVTGTAAITSPLVSIGCGNTEASGIDVYFDDVIYDDAGFLAPSKVAIALPISDQTVTAVTGGAAGTTNLWDAINNTPPAGVASASETDLTNIKYPASLTEDYIANLTTYTSLGVASGDTVLAVQSIVRHGEDVSAGTKTMQNAGALTNPTVAGSTVTFGLDAGAHGADSTGSATWATLLGTLTTSPSVTLGTSPTIEASRISEARVGCIDFMGMLVVWTPAAVAANIPFVSPYLQLLAQ